MLEHVTVTRYVTPLREGGSLPAIVEADNLGTYVMKFRGAGQGPLALVAEIIAGELARRLGLRVPELVLADLDPRIPARPCHRAGRRPRRARPAGHASAAPGGDRAGAAGVVRRPRRRRLRGAPPAARPDRGGGDPQITLENTAEVFEYALVRVVPRVERGEAINAGVIVYAQAFRYLCAKIELDESRLLALDPAADLDEVRAGLSAFEKACTEGPLADRPLGERFRWLTAPRSTIVQPGPVHSGLTADPAAELTHLFDTLVRT